ITPRSSVAPDFPAPSVRDVRSVAPAMSSATLANTPGANTPGADTAGADTPGADTAGASGIDRLHLGQQRGRPAPPAHHGVGHDVIIAHGEQVHVMGRVRHAVLGPAERVLHELARAPVGLHREPAELPELAR